MPRPTRCSRPNTCSVTLRHRLRATLGSALALTVGLTASRARAEPSTVEPQVLENYGFDETARSVAMAGAVTALGNGTTGVFWNPAAIAETRVYHIEGLALVTPEGGPRTAFGGAIVDSVTGRLAGGISVVGGFADPDGLDRSKLDVRLALAYPVSDKLFVGFGGRYLKLTELPHAGPYAPFASAGDPVAGGLDDGAGGRSAMINGFTFDAGLAVKASDAVSFGVVGKDLTFEDTAFLPPAAGGGIGVGTGDVTIEADALADFKSWQKTSGRFMVGGELLAADHFPLRAGYRYDTGGRVHGLSGGVGYLATEFSVDLSVRRSFGPSAGATEIAFGLAYFLESTGLTRRGPAGAEF